MTTFEYGAVSSKFSVQAENKLTAYAAMIVHYEGQVAIRYTGDIDFYDEAGEKEKSINIPKAFHYLLSLGIDLFGLIDAGLPIDAATIKTEGK